VGHHVYIVANTGWPSATTLKWGYSEFGNGWNQDAFISDNGNVYNYTQSQRMVLRADIPSGATPGDYTITIATCTVDSTGGVCTGGDGDTLSFTITVTALTYLSDANEGTSFTAIPGLSTWVSYMTSGTFTTGGAMGGDGGGASWCNSSTGATNPTDVSSFGNDQIINYYDGAITLNSIAVWTGNTGWAKCAQNILQQVAYGNANSIVSPNGYYLPSNGCCVGERVFPIGYEKAVGQDPRYVQVVQDLAGIDGKGGGQPWLYRGCNPSDGTIRENAYALDIFLSIDRMGLTPVDPPGTIPANTWKQREQRCADEVIQILGYYVDGTKRFVQNQYFFDGLAMDALIHWWQRTKDPRVPLVVKPILDQYYSNYNLGSHIAMWNPEPVGPRCIPAAVWYHPDVDDHCRDNTTPTITQLHNLFVHAFAWYWRISGNDAYKTEGDEIFSHGIDTLADKGKSFNQIYRYSFNYVGWRQGWLSPERSIQ